MIPLGGYNQKYLLHAELVTLFVFADDRSVSVAEKD